MAECTRDSACRCADCAAFLDFKLPGVSLLIIRYVYVASIWRKVVRVQFDSFESHSGPAAPRQLLLLHLPNHR